MEGLIHGLWAFLHEGEFRKQKRRFWTTLFERKIFKPSPPIIHPARINVINITHHILRKITIAICGIWIRFVSWPIITAPLRVTTHQIDRTLIRTGLIGELDSVVTYPIKGNNVTKFHQPILTGSPFRINISSGYRSWCRIGRRRRCFGRSGRWRRRWSLGRGYASESGKDGKHGPGQHP